MSLSNVFFSFSSDEGFLFALHCLNCSQERKIDYESASNRFIFDRKKGMWKEERIEYDGHYLSIICIADDISGATIDVKCVSVKLIDRSFNGVKLICWNAMSIIILLLSRIDRNHFQSNTGGHLCLNSFFFYFTFDFLAMRFTRVCKSKWQTN